MSRADRLLLVVSYAILVLVVAFGAFWIEREFDRAHDNDCSIAQSEASIAGVNLALADGHISEHEKALLNDAIRELNDTCGLDIPPVRP